jgi:hypothetical protein
MRQPARTGVKRAALLSTGAHGALLVLLMVAGPGQGPPPTHSPIIEAELISGLAPRAPAAAEREPAQATATPPPVEPSSVEPSLPARAGAAPVEPPVDAPAPPPIPPPPVPATPPPAARPPPEPAATPPPAPPPAPAVARGADTPSPPATSPLARDATPGAATPPPDEPPAVAAEPPPATAAPPLPPSEPVADDERQMLEKRLASWTGELRPDDPEPQLRWRSHGDVYTAVLRKEPAADAMGLEHLTVEVSTERDGNRMLTELRMTRLAFSSFAQFVDRWDPEVAIHDDEIDGRFHSNSAIHVSSGAGAAPVFRGKVTLAARDIETDSIGFGPVGFVNRHALFPAGLETMVRRISLAPRLPPVAAPEDVQHLTQDAAITFYADGSYGWRSLDGNGPERRRALTDRPHYVIGAENVTLTVRGTVNGSVLVYTPGRIVIVGNLRYAQAPTSPGADDYLGLVAERSVEIAEPEVTGTGDLEVYASIYARGRFAVQRFRSRPAGRLLIYGSLAAGSLTATEPRYATTIRFDPRLTTMRAPGFPLSDRYELESVSGEWRRAE